MTVHSSDKSVSSSFWFNVKEFIQHEALLTNIFALFPQQHRSKCCINILIYHLVDLLWKHVQKCVSIMTDICLGENASFEEESNKNPNSPCWDGSLTSDEEKREVCGVLHVRRCFSDSKKEKNFR